MATYRIIVPGFWDDVKILETFTPEDKYFYLYLLTNKATNLIGCYELSINKAAYDTGYNEDTIKHLINRMSNVHGVIDYDWKTYEVLILNWSKYNWSKSPKLDPAISRFIDGIKSIEFKKIIIEMYNKRETVDIPYPYPMDTSVSVSVSVPVSDTGIKEKPLKSKKVDLFEEYTSNDNLISALRDFAKFRQEIKKPMTERAIKLLLTELDKIANSDEEKIELLNKSIMNGWKSVYPIQNKQNTNTARTVSTPEYSTDSSIDGDVDELKNSLKGMIGGSSK